MGLGVLLVAALVVAVAPEAAWACSVTRMIEAQELVRDADLVVRASAVDYVDEAVVDRRGRPRIRFDVLEVLRGASAPAQLSIRGTLTSYRRGGQFLLFLKQSDEGYTPYWAALAPVNEQLRSDDDPWLLWVREAVR